jgi:alanyl-tRNA synthetase
MGETGPCGPCSEIHIDLRSDEERQQIPGADLVNNDHPQVIEIWNNVFMQFERKADKSLVSLPDKHVDTGMGFERLVRAIHSKTSNYDTDIFMPTIDFISKKSGIEYHFTESTNSTICSNCVKQDIAMRVIADHIRTISFTIADGQLPSNTGAGYVIRRILRRAVRYGYSALNFETPFLHEIVGLVANQFASIFPELKAQEAFVAKVILEEETSFLRTLSHGIKRFEAIEKEMNGSAIVPGKVAFELFDTYGFPLDLTKLLAAEKGFTVDEVEFESELQIQKNRSRKAAETEQSDWVQVADDVKTEFLGYDSFEVKSHVVKYRKTKVKDTDIYQLVLDKTPFYAESGGQIGDSGYLDFAGEKIDIFDTKKENDLIIHFAKKLPAKVDAAVDAKINLQKRTDTTRNHSATHLLQAALREVLGAHVQQKGSLVTPDNLRFDFSHFAKVTDEEIAKVEQIVNEKIMQNIVLDERRNVAIADAEKLGATMLFGEKYGDFVRVITFDEHFSRELCGGCHVPATGVIGLFKITSEGSVAAGVRRIEAVTGRKAVQLANDAIAELANVKLVLNNSKNVLKSIDDLVNENKLLKKEVEEIAAKQVVELKNQLLQKIQVINGVNVIAEQVEIGNNDALKNLVYMLKGEVKDFVFVLGASINGKANVHIMIEEGLSKAKGFSAGAWIKELSPIIKGGGGGQPFYASAGGNDPSAIKMFIEKAVAKI